MTGPIESDKPEVDDAGVELDEPELGEAGDVDEEVERAPQPGNTPAPDSPPYDSPLPREREEQ